MTCWELSDLGQGLGPESLKRAPKQKSLIEQLRQSKEAVPEAELLGQFTKNIIKQLQQKGLIASVESARNNELEIDNILKNPNLILDPQQQKALDTIELHQFASYLLDGVTSSGKTEIYLQSIEKTLAMADSLWCLSPK